jgi:hypothetical protein
LPLFQKEENVKEESLENRIIRVVNRVRVGVEG